MFEWEFKSHLFMCPLVRWSLVQISAQTYLQKQHGSVIFTFCKTSEPFEHKTLYLKQVACLKGKTKISKTKYMKY